MLEKLNYDYPSLNMFISIWKVQQIRNSCMHEVVRRVVRLHPEQTETSFFIPSLYCACVCFIQETIIDAQYDSADTLQTSILITDM